MGDIGMEVCFWWIVGGVAAAAAVVAAVAAVAWKRGQHNANEWMP